jgi:mannose-6-phosphate isomerase-like protein (cupin superfamily)
MTETRPWGEFHILHEEEKCKVKKLVVKPGQKFSLQTHEKRSELWSVIEGTGEITLDDEISQTQAGMIYFIPAGVKHRLENMGTEDLVVIEVQTGSSFSEEDIVRYEDVYGRV